MIKTKYIGSEEVPIKGFHIFSIRRYNKAGHQIEFHRLIVNNLKDAEKVSKVIRSLHRYGGLYKPKKQKPIFEIRMRDVEPTSIEANSVKKAKKG